MATAVPRTGRHARPRASARLTWPFARRAALPALRAQLDLSSDERILVTATGSEADSIVGTARAIYWCPPGAAWLRLGWEEIFRVEESSTDRNLILTSVSSGETRRNTLRVRDTRQLLAFAQERIAASRIVVTRITIEGRELWIEGRRQPVTGRLDWFVHAMHGPDLDDPQLPDIIDRATADLRTSVGLDGYL